MSDKEKVAEYLETCMQNRVISESFSEVIISLTKAEEIFALLKEQEAVKVQYTAMGGLRYGACPKCDAHIDNLVNPKACGFCGQAVKWE